MVIHVKPIGDRVRGSPRRDSCCGLFSVPARAICCAWRNIWHERRTAGSLSARKYGTRCLWDPGIDRQSRAGVRSARIRKRRWSLGFGRLA
jgi:hypothetical protein